MALAVFIRIIILQFVQSDKWAAMADKVVFRRQTDKAARGDILSDDGRILASSVPYYTVYMDTRSSGMADTTWATASTASVTGFRNMSAATPPRDGKMRCPTLASAATDTTSSSDTSARDAQTSQGTAHLQVRQIPRWHPLSA
jgi:cell division protein FtsI/penicillin-binding protein 2